MHMTSEWVEQWLYVCHRRQHAALAVCVKNKLVVLTTECMVTLVADKLKRQWYSLLIAQDNQRGSFLTTS